MPVPTARDETETRLVLGRWLRGVTGADEVEVGAIEIPQLSGFSNETLMFDAALTRNGTSSTKRLVAKVRPTGYAIFPEYDMSLQYRCMQVVGTHTSAPVPPLVGYEPDESILGQPFYVMERVEGRVPSDSPPYVVEGWVKDASPADQEVLYRASLEAMAAIGTIDVTDLDIAFLDRPSYGPPGLAQQVAYYEMSFDWALKGRTSRVVEAATAWLHANMPKDPPPNTVTWGDSRPGNILYSGFRPAAVLDWEMAAIGPAEVDLGYWLMFMDYHPSSSEVPPLPGFLSRDDTISIYGELVGRPMRDIEVYEFFAWYRFAMVLIRVSDEFVGSGQIPAEMEFALTSPAMAALADRLDMALT
ncbi:MAG: phosphotransferase family protein [Acidimicrobiales bacterium]